ncbi:MAG: hypothetical protein Q7R91_00735 [bacterium]|nr:hypothetical protein [bacterium]
MPGQPKQTFGVVTKIQYDSHSMGFDVTLDEDRTFHFPCIFIERNEFKVGRRIFMDFTAWPQKETGIMSIHVFKSDEEMKKECDGTVDGKDICYVKTYSLLKEFIPWAA